MWPAVPTITCFMVKWMREQISRIRGCGTGYEGALPAGGHDRIDFAGDFVGGFLRISGASDGAADDEVIRAGGDCFGGSSDSRLVVRCITLRADARDDDQEIRAARAADWLYFVGRWGDTV